MLICCNQPHLASQIELTIIPNALNQVQRNVCHQPGLFMACLLDCKTVVVDKHRCQLVAGKWLEFILTFPKYDEYEVALSVYIIN